MNHSKYKTGARWLAAIVVLLCLTLLGGQISFTQEPVREYGLGDIPLDPETYQKYLKAVPADVAESLPSAYDARDDGIVTPAKDQGGCGSCWAFANVGSMESHLLKAGFGPTDLSEQQLVSCVLSSSGCCGGYASSATYWETVGPIYESCFPYAECDTGCAQAQRTVACSESAPCEQIPYRILEDSWGTVPATPTGFKTSLYDEGPGYWRFNVYSDFDVYWSSGTPEDVYVSQPGYTYRGGHAVLLIGWDDSKGANGAYLCKNSWGTLDGPNCDPTSGGPNGDGTFWIAYSGHYYSLGFGMYNFGLVPLGCSSNADCDDGLFCNGAETCVDSVCQDGTPHTCPDDGEFCNGSEVCDEASQGCTHTGDPCAQGTICNETTNQCDVVACFADADCDDGDSCTTDACFNAGTANAYCENAWPDCGAEDNCCGPACTWVNDPDCTWCGNGACEAGEDCNTCSADCTGGTGGTPEACWKYDGICHPKKEDATCVDCAPSWCCGDGTCEGEEDSYNCAIDCGNPPECGDGTCDEGEDSCNCAADCGDPESTEVSCSDGVDNDCDGDTDCDDSECTDNPICNCGAKRDPCTTDDECCSKKCRGGKCL